MKKTKIWSRQKLFCLAIFGSNSDLWIKDRKVLDLPETAELIHNLLRGDILVDRDDPDMDGVPNPDGFLELRDSWGHMIIYMASNDQNPGNGGAPLLPAHTTRFFTSAGEQTAGSAGQGVFGDHAGSDGLAGTGDDTERNDLYSFEIE